MRSVKITVIHVGVIALVGTVIYGDSLRVPFVFDDEQNIRKNRFVRLEQFDLQGLYDASFKSTASNRPVANITFALNHLFGRYNVAGYHVVNVAVHLVNGVLVYLFARITFGLCFAELAGSRGRRGFMSLASALFFVAHPLQTQSVTYIVQRMNSMATLFTLVALLLYLRGRLRPAGRYAVWLGACVCWIVALGCKQIAAPLPLAILLYEFCFLRTAAARLSRRQLGALLGLVAVGGVIVCVLFGDDALRALREQYAYRDFTLGQRVLTQFRVVGFYASLLVFPYPARLNLTHDLATSQSLIEPATTLLWIAGMGVLGGMAALMARRHRLMVFCLLWVAIHLIIESSIFPLEMIFEHRMYLPLVGPALAVSGFLYVTLGATSWRAVGVTSVVVLALGIGTVIRNGVWLEPKTLWLDASAKSPGNSRAQNNLGNTFKNEGNVEEAMVRFHEALRLDPRNARAMNNMGNALRDLDRDEEAIERYRDAIAVGPDRAEVQFNLGNALRDRQRIDESIDALRRAVELKPDFVSAHYNLGLSLAQTEDVDGAIHHFQIVMKLDPDFADVEHNLEAVLQMKQRQE